MANSDNIIELKARKVYQLDEINNIIPIIIRITRQYNDQVQELIRKIEAFTNKNDIMAAQMEREVNDLIQEWQVKLEKLGGVTKGLWLADFDSGDGYYCWKFPEEKILHWHKYNDGFSGRKPIQDYLRSKENQPEATL